VGNILELLEKWKEETDPIAYTYYGAKVFAEWLEEHDGVVVEG